MDIFLFIAIFVVSFCFYHIFKAIASFKMIHLSQNSDMGLLYCSLLLNLLEIKWVFNVVQTQPSPNTTGAMDSGCCLCVYWDLQGIVSGGSLPPGDFSTWDGGVGMSKARAF